MRMVIVWVLGLLAALPATVLAQGGGGGRGRSPESVRGPEAGLSVILGRPTGRSVTVSVRSEAGAGEAWIEYGPEPRAATGAMSWGAAKRTAAKALAAGLCVEFEIDGLAPDSAYVYRLRVGGAAAGGKVGDEVGGRFRTARPRGEGGAFTFGVQGDSHPERLGRMFDPDLYVRALSNAAADRLDFYFLMGDDFSIERLIERGDKRQEAVDAVYAQQRGFLSIVGRSTPLMLVNGNHEQAAKYLLDGTAANFAVLAGRARVSHFPLPGPDVGGGGAGFYSGNATPVQHVGLVRDYYAWEWGDALFVVIDPYWHSDVAVDNEAGVKAPRKDAGRTPAGGERGAGDGDRGGAKGGGRGQRDLWQITLGDEQYRWLRSTLIKSDAKFKFVFSHHVSGTGRGGVEVAPYYEWGGQDRRGGGGKGRQSADEPVPGGAPQRRGLERFFQLRPTWEQPIHDLMRDAGVTIFFQGHDHLYARQELEGVIYQTCPNPADPTFTAFNREAYRSGDIYGNSGHLRVTVRGGDAAECTVEYVRAARPGDEAEHGKNGSIVHSYTVKPRAAVKKDNGPRGGK